MPEPTVVCVTGADGFVGRHLAAALQRRSAIEARLLVRRSGDGNRRCLGDLLDRASLSPFLSGCRYLINLVDPQVMGGQAADRALQNLARGARKAGVRRVVHLSTATVVGRCRDLLLTERSRCAPHNSYEAGKLRAEVLLRGELGPDIDFGILRPTGIVGAGSRNLRKLAGDILDGPAWKRHVLRFLHGHRQMHLVPVEAVVDALLFLLWAPEPLAGEAFIISAEGDALDRYQRLDAHLGALLGRPARAETAAVPGLLLSALLRLAGCSLCNPRQRFSSAKLRQRGFLSGATLESAIAAFVEDLRQNGETCR